MSRFIVVPDNHRFRTEMKIEAENLTQAAFEFMILMTGQINTANLFPGDEFATVRIGDQGYHIIKI